MGLSVPLLGQAMPRMRADLPVVHVSKSHWAEARRRFRKLKKIGEGAFGRAFAGTLKRQKVIVKVATGLPGAVALKTAYESLHREIVVLGKLQRFPFVPRLLEVGPDYFVQEDVGGEAMILILDRRGLEAREVLSVAIAVGIMTSHIHKEGIAHRDLEPRNILLTPHGVVLIDFGVAVERKESEELWKEGVKHDFLSILGIVSLAATAEDLPEGARVILASVIEKFQKRSVEGTIDENTSEELSKELFFVAAQIGARAVRGKVLKARKIKVVAI